MEVKTVEFRGVTYVNTTPHPITFRTEEGEEFVVEPSGVVINAASVEVLRSTSPNGVEYVETRFEGTDEGNQALLELLGTSELEKFREIIIVGSIIAAQAYPPKVVAMTPAKGYERVPVAEKRMNPFKFTIFS